MFDEFGESAKANPDLVTSSKSLALRNSADVNGKNLEII